MNNINVTSHRRRKPYGGYTVVVSHKRNLIADVKEIEMTILKEASIQWVSLKRSGKTNNEIRDILSGFYDISMINKIARGIIQ